MKLADAENGVGGGQGKGEKVGEVPQKDTCEFQEPLILSAPPTSFPYV